MWMKKTLWKYERVDMGLIGDFIKGFLAMAFVIYVFDIVEAIAQGQVLFGVLLLVALPVPILLTLYKRPKYKVDEVEKGGNTDRLRLILISLYGVSFACWVYDVSTTFYAIDFMRVAVEENPLGWPFGALGALALYVPTFVFTYFLLFRLKQKSSTLVAAAITFVTLYVGSMNFLAGGRNFSLILSYLAFPSMATYGYLFCIAIVVDVAYAVVFIRLTRPELLKRKPNLCTVAVVLSAVALIASLAQPTYNLINSLKQQGQPSFELAVFSVTYTHTVIEIRNNGSATANNVHVTSYFWRRLNISYVYRYPDWATSASMPVIKQDRTEVLIIPVGRYHLESAFSGTNVTDYVARISVFCVYEETEIHATFDLDHFDLSHLSDP